jgi:hypothetical protein
MARGEAELLLDNQLLKDTFAKLERNAVEAAVNAGFSDDETRRTYTMQVRAIRSVWSDLRSHLGDVDTQPDDPVA